MISCHVIFSVCLFWIDDVVKLLFPTSYWFKWYIWSLINNLEFTTTFLSSSSSSLELFEVWWIFRHTTNNYSSQIIVMNSEVLSSSTINVCMNQWLLWIIFQLLEHIHVISIVSSSPIFECENSDGIKYCTKCIQVCRFKMWIDKYDCFSISKSTQDWFDNSIPSCNATLDWIFVTLLLCCITSIKRCFHICLIIFIVLSRYCDI